MEGFFGFVLGGVGGAVIGILIGVLIAQGLGFAQSGGTNIPYNMEHTVIANGFVVRDVTWGRTLSLHHLQTGPITFSPYAPLSTMFPARHPCDQSIWTYTSDQDIDMVLVIDGPGTDGHTYLAIFSRQMANEVSIAGFNVTLHWPSGAEPGWQVLEVKLD